MTHSTTRATKVLLLAGAIGIAGFAQLGIAQASTVLPATTVAETTTTSSTTTSSTTAPTTTAATTTTSSTTTSSTTAPTTTAATTTTSSTTTSSTTTSSTTAPASSTTVNAGATTTAVAANTPLVSPTAPAAESGKGRVTSADGTSVEAVVAATPQGVRVCSSVPAGATTTSTTVASTTVASPFVAGALCMVLPATTDVTIDAGKATVKAGAAVRVLASGFKANSSVEVWAFSTPKLLKTFTTDASGILDGSVTMPAAIGNGTHTLQVEGTTTSGAAQAISFAVTVAGSSASGTTPLPFTGPSTALPMLLLATITGFFGLYIRRRSI